MLQIAGAILGVILANYLFDLDPFQFSEKARSSCSFFLNEIIATFGLLLVILLSSKEKVTATWRHTLEGNTSLLPPPHLPPRQAPSVDPFQTLLRSSTHWGTPCPFYL
jgi:hypothetical protein